MAAMTENKRNHFFDNAKAILMLLVVFGHLIEPAIDSNPLIKAIYLTIYSFHMPAFVFISGVFSKNSVSDEQTKSNIKGILIPFIVFEVIYELFTIIQTGKISGYLLGIQPHWILWYLLSLFTWKILAPIVNQFRFPLTLAVGLALLAGYCESIGYFLGLSRTIVFFPFFLLGLNYKEQTQHFHSTVFMRIASFFILLCVFFVFLRIPNARPGWFYGSYPYSVFNLDEWYAGIYRLCTYGLSVTLILAFLCLMPTKETFLKQLGINTLAIYVWHGLLMKAIRSLNLLDDLLESNAYFYLSVTCIAAIVICYLLSRDKVTQFTQQYLFAPTEKLLFGTHLQKNK